MGKQLVLAEKPSVGRDFANALNCGTKEDGYFEGPNFVITWTIGHLLGLAPPEHYNPELKKWSIDSLPIIPDRFDYVPNKKTAKQLKVITKLIRRKDVESAVLATDCAREGELIARLVLEYAECRKPMYRFWTSQALTPQIIEYGMRKGLKPAKEFERIYRAGYQRAIADWLVGMNLSRCASLKMGNNDTYSIGRVQTAVLSLLYDRKIHRDKFKSEPYWIFRVHFSNQKGKWVGSWFKENGGDRQTSFKNKEDARNIALKVKGANGSVLSVKKEKKNKHPPQLYSLTLLQRDANNIFGFTAQQTLDIAQALYEKYQAISYPRTDSQVLGSQSVNMAQSLISKLSQHYPDHFKNIQKNLISQSNKRVFNDAKLTDHHALIPLKPAASGFSDTEQKIYKMILTRFAAVFHPNYEYEAIEIITIVNGETFITRGSLALKMGWRDLYPANSTVEELLPPLSKNDPANIEKLDGEEKQTQPLPEYTEAGLLGDMSNPAKYVEEDSLKVVYRGDVGLGTQATRAQIIEILIKRGYISRSKKKLLVKDKGCTLISLLRQLPISSVLSSPVETAKWEQMLNSISLGEANDTDFANQIQQFIINTVEEFKGQRVGEIASAAVAENSKFGICPVCGGGIIEGKKGFGCANWRSTGCKFVIWKTVAGKKLGRKDVVALLEGKRTNSLKFKSKKGNEFQAAWWTFDKDNHFPSHCPEVFKVYKIDIWMMN